MAELLGGLALFAAIGALALAGAALTKIDRQFNELVESQINPLRDRLMQVEGSLDDVRKTMGRLDIEGQNSRTAQQDTFKAIAQMNESIDKLSTRITEVNDSIATRMNRKVSHR